MKKVAVLVSSFALVGAIPASAAKPMHPAHPSHPTAGKGAGQGSHTGSCAALNKGYYATGPLVSGMVTPGTKKDRYDGTLTVDVKRANHRARHGSQTFRLNDARVRFGKGVSKTTLTAGERVILHGKITALRHGCSTSGFSPKITVRNVTIKAAKPAKH